MAELGILLTPTEERSIVEFVLSKGAFLVPDIDYSSGEHATVRSLSDYLRYRAATRLFFIVHQDYLTAPLEMRQTVKGGNLVYYVTQRNGGPSIDFLSTVEFTENSIAKVNPGFIAHHCTFWNPITGQNEKPPTSMIRLFGEIRSVIRSMAMSAKLGKRSYLIGEEMSAALKSGTKTLGIDGVSVATIP
jgi:hypothetical protein